jgi:hypothetical protein
MQPKGHTLELASHTGFHVLCNFLIDQEARLRNISSFRSNSFRVIFGPHSKSFKPFVTSCQNLDPNDYKYSHC